MSSVLWIRIPDFAYAAAFKSSFVFALQFIFVFFSVFQRTFSKYFSMYTDPRKKLSKKEKSHKNFIILISLRQDFLFVLSLDALHLATPKAVNKKGFKKMVTKVVVVGAKEYYSLTYLYSILLECSSYRFLVVILFYSSLLPYSRTKSA